VSLCVFSSQRVTQRLDELASAVGHKVRLMDPDLVEANRRLEAQLQLLRDRLTQVIRTETDGGTRGGAAAARRLGMVRRGREEGVRD
jgi:hypothetical protein